MKQCTKSSLITELDPNSLICSYHLPTVPLSPKPDQAAWFSKADVMVQVVGRTYLLVIGQELIYRIFRSAISLQLCRKSQQILGNSPNWRVSPSCASRTWK